MSMKPREYVLAILVPPLVIAWLVACFVFQGAVAGYFVDRTTPWADEEVRNKLPVRADGTRYPEVP